MYLGEFKNYAANRGGGYQRYTLFYIPYRVKVATKKGAQKSLKKWLHCF